MKFFSIVRALAYLVIIASSTMSYAQLPIINTIAGNGTAGYSGDGGPAVSAKLNNPVGSCLDNFGNMYIADYGNNVVRKVSVSGIISTFAGNGTAGFSGDGGLATSAELNGPRGVAVDSLGNVYIADESNNRIRMVNTAGIISTFAGNGTVGPNGGVFGVGPAGSAELWTPTGVAVDGSGNVYISVLNLECICKVKPNGIISLFAGNEVGYFSGDGGLANSDSAELFYPSGVTVDCSGNVYIADTENSRIRKVNSTNDIISTFAGIGPTDGIEAVFSGDGGSATSAELYIPQGVAIDGCGNVYIADTGNQRIRKVATNGVISTIAGNGIGSFSGDGGPAASAELNSPKGISVDDFGNVYIADSDNNRIRKLSVQSSLTSATGTNTQTVHEDSAITAITYSVSGTGASVEGLPSGVVGIYNANIFTISGTPTITGTYNYAVTFTAPHCCSPYARAMGDITVMATNPLVLVPNVFTPNGDGVNDLFVTKGLGENDKITIYNRWGNKITEFSGTSNGWDGTTNAGEKCTDGIYYYVLQSASNIPSDIPRKGFVQLIR